ncbi:MAG: hypothetical protein ABR881_13360 [Candidatus Sulfotelmatobacter sp.]
MPALQSNATTGTGVNWNWIPWGGKGMATRIAFLERSRVLPILLSVICLLAPAAAQHGGGGGHSGGGHFGGGRSSGGHSSGRHSGRGQSGGHFGWLRLGFGKRSARHAGLGTASASDISPRGPLHLWNIPAGTRMPATARIPSTLLSPPLFPRRPDGQVSFVSSAGRRHRGVFFNRYRRFYSSGCFLNGVTQFCCFEPFLPLLSFSGYFDFFDSGFGFGGDSLDPGDELNSQGPPQWEASAIPPTANPSDDDTAEGNSSANPGTALGAVTEGQALGSGVFLLVLNNGTSHAVTDYWVADGYLEYISPDGIRSHIPLDALNLQQTVTQNAPRGHPFVLRSTPAQNR